jgi:hypothetical protein
VGRIHHEDKTFCVKLAGSLPVHGQQQTERLVLLACISACSVDVTDWVRNCLLFHTKVTLFEIPDWCSSVIIVTKLQAGRLGNQEFSFSRWGRFFCSRRPDWIWGPPTLLPNGVLGKEGGLFPRLKNARRYTSITRLAQCVAQASTCSSIGRKLIL